MNKKQKPTVYIIAGSNGAGKTTFARKYLPKFAGRHIDFINADLIASGLSPLNSDKMVIQASRIVLRRIKELSESKKDFAFETTLSGHSYSVLLRRIKQMGYRVHLYYLWIPNYKLAIERIKGRVLEGGHNVSVEIVRRRFGKTLHNLFHVYLPLIDYLAMIDNSSKNPRTIFEKVGDMVRYIDFDLSQQIIKGENGVKRKIRTKLTKEGKRAETAMKEAIADVIRDHKLKKIPLAVWQKGRVVKIPPEKLS